MWSAVAWVIVGSAIATDSCLNPACSKSFKWLDRLHGGCSFFPYTEQPFRHVVVVGFMRPGEPARFSSLLHFRCRGGDQCSPDFTFFGLWTECPGQSHHSRHYRVRQPEHHR